MSQLEAASEGVSYVHCTFCNTVLAVSVPCSSLMMAAAAGYNNVVTVRCGHCSNLLSVNLGALHQTAANVAPIPHNHPHNHHQLDHHLQITKNVSGSSSSSSSSSINRCINFTSAFESADAQNAPPTRISPIPPPEKRQRIPSAYNRFIKEEIQRIKASSPEITHREAFSMAAKNWAHFPRIHFGLKVESNKRPKPDGAFMAGEATSPKSHEFY